MTGADHAHNAAVEQAAMWLSEQNLAPRPIVPALRQRFNLSALEACEAAAMAEKYRMLRGAFS
jgi:hypothetical protein